MRLASRSGLGCTVVVGGGRDGDGAGDAGDAGGAGGAGGAGAGAGDAGGGVDDGDNGVGREGVCSWDSRIIVNIAQMSIQSKHSKQNTPNKRNQNR